MRCRRCQRTANDIIQSGVPISGFDLGLGPGGEVVVYIEGLAPSYGTIPVEVYAEVEGVNVQWTCAVGTGPALYDLTYVHSILVDLDTQQERIFINKDDDNMNGKPDVEDDYGSYTYGGTNYEDKDFSEIKIDLTNISLANFNGYTLWLGSGSELSLYSDKQKEPLTNAVAAENLPAGFRGIWYAWTITGGDIALPNKDGSTGTAFAEGRALGEHSVVLRLVAPDGVVIAEDTLEISVEKMVWPNQDPTVTTDLSQPTTEWNGFELEDGWFISSSLSDIINGTTGYIRTEYPELSQGRWEGTPNQNSDAKLDLAELCGTNQQGESNWANGATVRIEVSYEFEQSPSITAGQYVDTNRTKWKPGFFQNSGIKIENRSEIQIFDTASLLEAINNGHPAIIDGNPVTISADPSNDIDQTGEVLLRHTGSQALDWEKEPVNALITGIPYLTGPNTWQTLSNAPTGAKTLRIDVYRQADGKYNFHGKYRYGHTANLQPPYHLS